MKSGWRRNNSLSPSKVGKRSGFVTAPVISLRTSSCRADAVVGRDHAAVVLSQSSDGGDDVDQAGARVDGSPGSPAQD